MFGVEAKKHPSLLSNQRKYDKFFETKLYRFNEAEILCTTYNENKES